MTGSSPNRPGPAIQVRNLCKTFKVYNGPLDILREYVFRRPNHKLFKALDNVSFSLDRGKVLGIIGPNGAGKSTLLRILAGTLDKTSGDVAVSGRISSILQLGIGFHPDFSGRENAFLAGVCHGLSKAEVRAKIPWIKDFSALGDFFEKPVRTYSSGMQARLFFSVAAAVEADVLLVDEALSVGDARFQRKCFTRMERFRNNGGAVILVSHDINLIVGLCDKAILLEKGQVANQGSPREVSRSYLKRVLSAKEEQVGELGPLGQPGSASLPAFGERYGDGRASIIEYGLRDEQGCKIETIDTGQACTVLSKAVVNQDMEELFFGFQIATVSGFTLFGFNTLNFPVQGPLTKGTVLEAQLGLRMWLAPGEYFLTLGIWPRGGPHYDRLVDVMTIRVVGAECLNTGSLVNLEPRLKLIRSTDSLPETREGEEE